MTIAIAYAANRRQPVAWITADARLTGTEGKLTDSGVKCLDVGRFALVMAGSVLPATNAAEIVRTFTASMERQGDPLEIQEVAALYAHFLLEFCIEMERSTEVVLAGLSPGGAPRLFHVVAGPDADRISLHAPPDGGCACVVIGDSRHRDLVAYTVDRARQSPSGDTVVPSLLWYLAQHGGDPFDTIGGGLAYGQVTPSDHGFQWPLIRIDGNNYLRGIHIPDAALRPSQKPPVPIEYDEDAAAACEREFWDADEGVRTGTQSVPQFTSSIREYVATDNVLERRTGHL